jgi:hypothetical protein
LDVFLNDPVKILADNVVTYEMCDFGTIIDQIKLMASLDWSSLADNVVRETMVLAIDLPEALTEIDTIVEAGKCLETVAVDTVDSAADEAARQADEAKRAEEEAKQKAADEW